MDCGVPMLNLCQDYINSVLESFQGNTFPSARFCLQTFIYFSGSTAESEADRILSCSGIIYNAINSLKTIYDGNCGGKYKI
jgi:hypothetical protein